MYLATQLLATRVLVHSGQPLVVLQRPLIFVHHGTTARYVINVPQENWTTNLNYLRPSISEFITWTPTDRRWECNTECAPWWESCVTTTSAAPATTLIEASVVFCSKPSANHLLVIRPEASPFPLLPCTVSSSSSCLECYSIGTQSSVFCCPVCCFDWQSYPLFALITWNCNNSEILNFEFGVQRTSVTTCYLTSRSNGHKSKSLTPGTKCGIANECTAVHYHSGRSSWTGQRSKVKVTRSTYCRPPLCDYMFSI